MAQVFVFYTFKGLIHWWSTVTCGCTGRTTHTCAAFWISVFLEASWWTVGFFFESPQAIILLHLLVSKCWLTIWPHYWCPPWGMSCHIMPSDNLKPSPCDASTPLYWNSNTALPHGHIKLCRTIELPFSALGGSWREAPPPPLAEGGKAPPISS